MEEKIKDLTANVTWLWTDEYFLETKEGNFIWKDHNYIGKTVIRPTKDSLASYLSKITGNNNQKGYGKGEHVVKDFCSEFVYRELG